MGRPPPGRVGQPLRVEVGVERQGVAEVSAGGEQGVELHLLDGAFRHRAGRAPPHGVEDLGVGERFQALGHGRLPLDDAQRRRAVHDLQVVPQLGHRLVDRRPAVGQREDAHHLREPGVRRGADEEARRLPAGLGGMRAQPGPRAAAVAERPLVGLLRLVQAAPLAAPATDDEVRQVAARAALVQPELVPAGVVGAVHEAVPVDVVDVPPGTRAHEAGGHHGPAVEPAPVRRARSGGPAAGTAAAAGRPGRPRLPRALPARRTTAESATRRCPGRAGGDRRTRAAAPGAPAAARRSRPGACPTAWARGSPAARPAAARSPGRPRWPTPSAGRSARRGRRW